MKSLGPRGPAATGLHNQDRSNSQPFKNSNHNGDRNRSLKIMGSNDEENQRENVNRSSKIPQPKKRRSSSIKLRQEYPAKDQENQNVSNNTKGGGSNNKSNNPTQQMAEAMMRQQRRRLLTTASILTPHITEEQPAWDGFVRKGTQLKSFLDEALQHVATGYAVTSNATAGHKRQRLEDDGITTSEPPPHGSERSQATAKIAKDKTKEAMFLQQKLEETQSQVAALKASNQTLREESSAASLRFERTVEALQIAAANAASARTDADQAEVSAECLATQLEALKIVVEQTKQAARVLNEEHEEISEQVKSGQAKLLQAEAELAQSQKENKKLRVKSEECESKAKELQEETTNLKRQLADETETSRKLAKTLEERDALEEARKKRSQQAEKELQEAQALLVEASSAAADSDAIANLKESVATLQEANKKLHEQLAEEKETAREDKERLRESLLVAEKDAQALRIEASLKSDQDVGRQHSTKSSEGGASTFAISSKNLHKMSTPTSSLAESSSNAVPPAATCCICSKAAFGLMKTCQCGKPDCDKRAHLTCANRINPGPSVSHPGTPAAKLPTVLCAGALADILKMTEA